MSTLILRAISAAREIKNQPLTRSMQIVAEPGVKYQIIDAENQKPYQKVVVKQKGKALLIEGVEQDGLLLQIEEFYVEGREAVLDLGPSGAGDSTLISAPLS